MLLNSTQSSKPKLSIPQLESLGDWLKDAFTYVGKNWLMLLKVYLWGMLMYFGAVLGLVILLVFCLFLLGVAVGLMGGQTMTPVIIGAAALFWLVVIVLALGVAGKLIILQISAAAEPVKDVRALWRKYTWQDGISFYWLLILIAFSVYGGLLVLVIPGIVISIFTSLALYVRFNQKIGGLKALMLSKDYLNGFWWQVFGRWMVSGLIILVFSVLPFLAYAQLTKMGGIWAVLGFVIYLLTIGLISSVFYRLGQTMYLNLVKIKGELVIKPSSIRTLGWSLVTYLPLILAVLAIIILIVANPAGQMKQAEMINFSRAESNLEPSVFQAPSDLILAK